MTKPASSIKLNPHCAKCGTSVDAGQQFCSTCAKLPLSQLPPAMIEVGKQPIPAYQRDREEID